MLADPTFQKTDVTRLKADLNQHIAEVALHYLGEPKLKRGNTWSYGSNKGSLKVTVGGDKQGMWHDFQEGEGGDALTLIQHTLT